jgi:hypothetical protein
LSVSIGVRPAAERKRGALAVVADAGSLDIRIEVGFEIVVRRHFMALAAFLVQTDPPALALGIVVLDTHGDGRTDASKGKRHHRNQRRAIACCNRPRPTPISVPPKFA